MTGGGRRDRRSMAPNSASKRPGASAASKAAANAPSTHRFQERRQERMRGAGTHVAIQRDFQFQLPPTRSALPPATSQPTSSSSQPRVRPSTSSIGAREASQRIRSETDIGDAELSLASSAYSRPSPSSSRGDASASVGVGRRLASRPPPPISSTPAASRILSKPPGYEPQADLFLGSPSGDIDDEIGSQIDEDEEDINFAQDDMDTADVVVEQPQAWDVSLPDMDAPLPELASAPSTTVRSTRIRPSEAAASTSGRTALETSVDHTRSDSPAARAASRNSDARKRKRQQSPGADREERQTTRSLLSNRGQGSLPKGKALPSSRSHIPRGQARAAVRVPIDDVDETMHDRTIMERQHRIRTSSSMQGKDIQRRLRRALTLVFSASEDADGGTGDDSRAVRRRKARKYLNDVDIIWSIVDEELRSAIEEQPAKAPYNALRALRKSVRSNFLALSEKTDTRTTLISQLLRARKQKRTLRKQVFATRIELTKTSVEASERQKEMEMWRGEVKDVRKVNSFLENLKDQATAWA